ncbi:DUF1833 family protein [Roseateles sp. SL47]|uniref:DUF1833 family protein n=1 Tax=Roseateles sp. SL47 TaxID=2995138 RepID=UPI00226DA8CA|nr:DUF1833 family protein [Roseateles sp. SL47]WAC75370.1 DUF1833 family protein [Roseateles sp. SL47]
MDKRTYWATKSPLPEFHSVTFEHPAFSAPFRLVANQFAEVTLGGEVHTPVAMTIKQPERQSDAQPKLGLSFSREQVGRDFKRELRRIQASTIVAPIAVTYAVYLGDTETPQITWKLFVSDSGGISFGNSSVSVNATVDNPMRRNVGPIYDPAVFTGLSLL